MAYGDDHRSPLAPKYSNQKYTTAQPKSKPKANPLVPGSGFQNPFAPRPLSSAETFMSSSAVSLGRPNRALSSEQLRNAELIVRIGKSRGLSNKDIATALATAMQESSLRNLNYGDRDSLGLFQQRPSQGWGSAAQVTDPTYATNKFYDALVRVKNRDRLSITQAAQKVQRSAYPNAYAKHEGLAWSLLGGVSNPRQADAAQRGVMPGNPIEQRLQRFIAAAPGGITITSGYRSVARQQQLWQEALRKYGSAEKARKWVAPPGSSEHNKGNAWDLSFANSRVRAWAHANAERFGLKFPLGNEPWHIEIAETRGGRLSPLAARNGITPVVPGTLENPGGSHAGHSHGGGFSMDDLARRYGFVAALFGSDPELASLVKRANSEGWDPGSGIFEAELMKTNWYRSRTQAQQQWDTLSHTNPADAQAKINEWLASLKDMANRMGVKVGEADLKRMAETFARNGYSSAESVLVRGALAAQLKYEPGADFGGEAGDLQDQINATLKAYGLPADPDYAGRKAIDILQGKATVEDVKNYAVNMAKTLYPALAKNLDAGMTVEEFATPYRALMTDILEINGAEADLSKDPLLRKALQGSGQDKGEPKPMALYDFELGLRNDPRWMKTNNARDSLMDVAGTVLRDFGLRS